MKLLCQTWVVVISLLLLGACGASPTEDSQNSAWIKDLKSGKEIKIPQEESLAGLLALLKTRKTITVKQAPTYSHEIWLGENQHWKVNLAGICEELENANQYYRIDPNQLSKLLEKLTH
jgi:hypothetical protein